VILLGICMAFVPTLHAEEGSESTALRWLQDGDGVLVGNRWIARTDGSSERLPGPSEWGSEPRSWHASLSPDGGSVLWSDGETELQVVRLGGSDEQSIPVPLWIRPPEEWRPEILPFWRSPNELWVEQVAHSPTRCGPSQHACATYRIDSRTWRLEESTECATSSFMFMRDIEPSGPDSWAVHASGDGAGAVDLVSRMRPGESLASFEIMPPLEQVEHVRSDLALVVTPCELDLEQRVCIEGSERWTLYRWVPASDGGKPTLMPDGRDLPTGARVSPGGDRIAWMERDQVCIRSLSGGTPDCRAEPRE
jgi:hypothetical protein